MFARVKQSGKHKYLQLVRNRRDGDRVNQQVVCTIGRLDQLEATNQLDKIVQSLAQFSRNLLLLATGSDNDEAGEIRKIGPSMIFDRLWEESGIKGIMAKLLKDRKFGFDVERAIFVTVLHRLFAPGSDRAAEQWMNGHKIDGVDEIPLHQFYRAMGWLGEELPKEQQTGALPFAGRCTKDIIEEELYRSRQNLFTQMEMVFFDTTSLYFEGEGGESLGEYGYSKDHRPDLKQMVVGAVMNGEGDPICCEMWPGNISDVKTLVPVANRLRDRFGITKMCVVADRGMISRETIDALDKNEIGYILGVRMRVQKEVSSNEFLKDEGYKEIYPARMKTKDPSPLKVKEITVNDQRYILCINEEQRRKDAHDREAIMEALKGQLKMGSKALVGNKGFRRYLKAAKGGFQIDMEKANQEQKYDGKWMLRTNTEMSTNDVALTYKRLWMVEQVFRDAKSTLDTRPIYHKCDETIRGHVFCSFLALVLRNRLYRLLEENGERFEWAEIQNDLKSLVEMKIRQQGKTFLVRSECRGGCGKIFQSVGVAIPPTVRDGK